MDPQTVDLDNFDKSLIGLFTLLKTIIKTHEKDKLNLSGVTNPILSQLERYIKIYDRTDPSEHLWYFQRLFNQNRSAILRGPERDNWLRNGKIIIHYGEEINKPIKNARINLSIIYNTAITLKDQAEESLHGLPNIEQSQEMFYPVVFLLHMYRVFYDICDNDNDKEKISGYIKDLEEDAGIKKSKRSKNDGDEGDGLEGLLGMATGFMEKMGLKLPEGQIPSGKDLNSAINGVFQNPEAKSFMGDMMKDMQNCDNFGDMVGKLLNKLPANMDPAAKRAISDNARLAADGDNDNDNNNSGGEDGDDGDEYGEGEDEFLD